MTQEIKSLHNYPLCDEVARENLSNLDERISVLENSQGSERTGYFDGGDLYDLLQPLEILEMAEADCRIRYTNPPRKQAYAGYTIHYFDASSLGVEKIWVSCLDAKWESGLYYYNPSTSAYTLLLSISPSTAKYLDLSAIPQGCYLCTSCLDADYTTGKYKYFNALYINPNYTPKFEGLDESVSDKPIKLNFSGELSQLYYGRPAFLIDMEQYRDCIWRITMTGDSAPDIRLYRTDDTTQLGTLLSSTGNNGVFSAWVYPEKYLVVVLNPVYDYSIFENVTFTMGWINPEVARVNKQKNYWGPHLMGHNADTRTQLINACVWADIVDIDVCKTLDNKYVCFHGTTINGHDITSTNLADLGLTYNQMSADDAYAILKRYGTFCFHNYRNATGLEQAEQDERAFNIVGEHAIWGENLTGNADHPLRGHLGKFWVTTTASAHSDTLVGFGAIPSKVIGSPNGDITKYDINTTYSISTLTAWDLIPTDGSCAYVWINSDPANALNAPLSSE